MSRHGHRFYLDTTFSPGQELVLPSHQAHQIQRVLRLQPGDSLVLFNGTGYDWPAVLLTVSPRHVVVRLGEPISGRTPPPPSITLALALLKREHFEFVIQKATELGIRQLIPLITERTIVRVAHEPTKQERWQRIAIEAAEQAGRTDLPTILAPHTLEDVRELIATSVSLVCWECETATQLATYPLPLHAPVVLLIGPEGGWSPGEIDTLHHWGATTVSLGPLTLRSETAAITAIAMLQTAYAWRSSLAQDTIAGAV